jgi:hypothetical protein
LAYNIVVYVFGGPPLAFPIPDEFERYPKLNESNGLSTKPISFSNTTEVRVYVPFDGGHEIIRIKRKEKGSGDFDLIVTLMMGQRPQIVLTPGKEVYVGRSQSNHLIVPHISRKGWQDGLSRFHLALVLRRDGRLIVRDNLSQNHSVVFIKNRTGETPLELEPIAEDPSLDPQETVYARRGEELKIKEPSKKLPTDQSLMADGEVSVASLFFSKKDSDGVITPDERHQRLKERPFPGHHPDKFKFDYLLGYVNVLLTKYRDSNHRFHEKDFVRSAIEKLLNEAGELLDRAQPRRISQQEEDIFEGIQVDGEGLRYWGSRQSEHMQSYLFEIPGNRNYYVVVNTYLEETKEGTFERRLLSIDLERRMGAHSFVKEPLDGEGIRNGSLMLKFFNGDPQQVDYKKVILLFKSNVLRIAGQFLNLEDVFTIDFDNGTRRVNKPIVGRLQGSQAPLPTQKEVPEAAAPIEGTLFQRPAYQLIRVSELEPRSNDYLMAGELTSAIYAEGEGEPNEDRYYVAPQKEFGAVADGVSTANGDVGAGIGLGTFAGIMLGYLTDLRAEIQTQGDLLMFIRLAITRAHLALRQEATRSRRQAETTLAGFVPFQMESKKYAAVFGYGNSHVFVYRNKTGSIVPITTGDDQAGQKMRKELENLKDFRWTARLGKEPTSRRQIFEQAKQSSSHQTVLNPLGSAELKFSDHHFDVVEVQEGDVLLTFSKGITGNFPNLTEMERLIRKNPVDAEEILRNIMGAALRKGKTRADWKRAPQRRKGQEPQGKDDDMTLVVQVVDFTFGNQLVLRDEPEPSLFQSWPILLRWQPSNSQVPALDVSVEGPLTLRADQTIFVIYSDAHNGPFVKAGDDELPFLIQDSDQDRYQDYFIFYKDGQPAISPNERPDALVKISAQGREYISVIDRTEAGHIVQSVPPAEVDRLEGKPRPEPPQLTTLRTVDWALGVLSFFGIKANTFLVGTLSLVLEIPRFLIPTFGFMREHQGGRMVEAGVLFVSLATLLSLLTVGIMFPAVTMADQLVLSASTFLISNVSAHGLWNALMGRGAYPTSQLRMLQVVKTELKNESSRDELVAALGALPRAGRLGVDLDSRGRSVVEALASQLALNPKSMEEILPLLALFKEKESPTVTQVSDIENVSAELKGQPAFVHLADPRQDIAAFVDDVRATSKWRAMNFIVVSDEMGETELTALREKYGPSGLIFLRESELTESTIQSAAENLKIKLAGIHVLINQGMSPGEKLMEILKNLDQSDFVSLYLRVMGPDQFLIQVSGQKLTEMIEFRKNVARFVAIQA